MENPLLYLCDFFFKGAVQLSVRRDVMGPGWVEMSVHGYKVGDIRMWVLNYCAPFVYNAGGTNQTIRYVLYACLCWQFLLYVFYISKYKLIGRKYPCMQMSSQ